MDRTLINNNIIGGGRNDAIDVARGIAMMLVIVQHCGAFGQFILSFHMPLFFVISGLVIKNKKPQNSFIEELKNNAKRLLLPQLTLGLFEVIFIEIFGFYETHTFKALTLAEVFNAIFRWWFLLVMFQVRMVIWLFRKYALGSKHKVLISVLLLSALSIFVELTPHHFYGTAFYPYLTPIATLFVLGGFYGKKLLLKESNEKIGFCVAIGLISLAILSETNNTVYMYKAEFGNMILFLLTATIGSFCVIRLSDVCNSKFLSWIGRLSLPIYVLQFHINQYSRAVQAILLDSFGCENVCIKTALTILFSVTACTVIAHAISKNKSISVLFGLK